MARLTYKEHTCAGSRFTLGYIEPSEKGPYPSCLKRSTVRETEVTLRAKQNLSWDKMAVTRPQSRSKETTVPWDRKESWTY